MITQHKHPGYSYWSRLMILPVSLLLFCTLALYAQKPAADQPQEQYTSSPAGPVTIIVDAGHGGEDPGAHSNDGKLQEKDIALQLSKKIQQLAPGYGIHVLMSRNGDYLPGQSGDISQSLRYRTALAQKNHADYFISIHVGAAEKVKKGNEMVPGSHGGMDLYITRNKQDIMTASRQLGASIIRSLSDVYAVNNTILQRRGKGIYVLDHADCPAVLLECGYITNDKDVAFITDEQHQEQIARKILEGVLQYRNGKDLPGTISDKAPDETTYNRSAMPAYSNRSLQMKNPIQDTTPVTDKIRLKYKNPYIKSEKEPTALQYKLLLPAELKINSVFRDSLPVKSYNATIKKYKAVELQYNVTNTYKKFIIIKSFRRNIYKNFSPSKKYNPNEQPDQKPAGKTKNDEPGTTA